MNNRTKGISLAIITAVMWGIMGMFVRGLIFPLRTGRWRLFPVFAVYKTLGSKD